MYKYKKMGIYLISILFIVLTIFELIIYLKTDSNLFGLIYMIINAVIVFLLVPTAYNYKKYYSVARISKLIIIIILGLFNSFILPIITKNSMNYSDASAIFINNIKNFRVVFKPIIYILLGILTIFEFKSENIINNKIDKKTDN